MMDMTAQLGSRYEKCHEHLIQPRHYEHIHLSFLCPLGKARFIIVVLDPRPGPTPRASLPSPPFVSPG